MTKNENLLVTLMEECAEVQQAVSKVIRFGADGCHPDVPPQTNGKDVLVEYYQLIAVMEMLIDGGVLEQFSNDVIARVKANKKLMVRHYQDVSCDIGCIKD